MMDYADSIVDALGVLYHEFIKYSGGDGSGLNSIVTKMLLRGFPHYNKLLIVMKGFVRHI